VLELDDLVDRAVNLDVVAVFELVGGDQVESVLLVPKIGVFVFLGASSPSPGWLVVERSPGRAS
jgi:hypothetical protein